MGMIIAAIIAFLPAWTLWDDGVGWAGVAVICGIVNLAATRAALSYTERGMGILIPKGTMVIGAVSLIILIALFIRGIT